MSERSIFLAALDISDPAQRSAYLNQACGNDAALRKHIEELVAAEANLGGFLARPHAAAEVTSDLTPATERPGTVIGPYKLMEQIGEGGFGLVFVAEQQHPVRRKVALKVIKPGMDTREVIARFEAERQALALMDHQNIAKVLDAGTTASGRPYFVMELVRGVPITDYCDVNHLTPRQRLELFVAVCQAVQHAHQKGVIHRDLKPSNILVAPHDGVPVVKVIDFGVAKALGQQLTDKTIYTRFAQMIGTPLYMSPEQAEINALDVDTRSDVYALGVLLYELLTGTTPFDKKRLASAAFDEIRRIIREEEPAKPSTRVHTMGATAATISAQRKTEPHKLSQLLRNELDWIVMKALEKDRTRRYETASAFAADVGRYLRDEQVEACPPSTMYRLSKFVRRNRVAFTSSALIAAALFVGIVVSTVLAVVASQQRKRAEMATHETEAARRAAENDRDQAEKARTEESQQRRLAVERESEAKSARVAEAEQRQSAEQERDKATTVSAQLQTLTQEQRRTIYAAEMNLVRLEAQRNNLAGMRELLLRQLPGPDEEDLRGFEWNYWYRFLHQAKVLLRLDAVSAQAPPDAISIVPGGELVACLRGRKTELIELATGKVRRTADGSLRVGADRTSFDASGRMVVGTFTSESAFAFQRGSTSPKFRAFQVSDIDGKLRNFDYPPDSFAYVSNLQISRNGKLVAAIGTDVAHSREKPACRILVFNFETGELLHNLLENRELNRIRFSDDGGRLAAFVCHSTLQHVDKARDVVTVFDMASGERLGLAQHDDDIDQLGFLPDSQHLLLTSLGFSGHNRKELLRWKVGEPALVRLGAEYMPDHLAPAVSPDGKLFAVASHTIPNVRLIDTTTGAVVHNLHSEATNITSITFSADGKQLIACGTMGVVLAWNLSDDNDLFAIRAKPLPTSAYDHAISADQSLLAYALSPIEIRLRRKDGTETTLTPTKPGPQRGSVRLEFSPNGRLLLSELTVFLSSRSVGAPGQSGLGRILERKSSVSIQVYDVENGKQLWGVELPTLTESNVPAPNLARFLAPPSLAFSADGKHLAAVRASQVSVWDARSGQVVQSPAADSPLPLAISGIVPQSVGGRLLFADIVAPAPEQARLRLVDAISGNPLAETNIPVEPSVRQIVPSMDGRHVAVVRGSDQVELWNLTGQRKALEGTGDYVVFSADGSKAAFVESSIQPSRGTPSPDVERIDRATLWDVAGSRQFCTVTFAGNRAERVIFSPDGKRLLSLHGIRSMSGGAIPEGRLWDVLSGREMMTIPVADVNHYTWDMAFEPTGTRLISCVLVKPYGSGGDGWGSSIIDGTPLSDREDAMLVAHPLVAEMLRRNPLAHEDIAELEANPKLRASVRDAAIALLRPREDKPELAAEACLQFLVLENAPIAQYERALKWAQSYQRRWPDDPVGSILIGAAQFRLGQVAQSLATLSSDHASRPATHTLQATRLRHSFLALANLQTGNFEKAEEHYIAYMKNIIADLKSRDRANSLSGPILPTEPLVTHPSIWLERIGKELVARYDTNADGQVTADEYQSSALTMSNFMASYDRNSDGIVTSAEYARRYSANFRSRMDPARRLESISTAIQRDPSDASPYGQRGDHWFQLGKYDQAIEDYTEAIRLDPTDPQYLSDRGYAQFEKKEYDKAIDDFTESLRLDPKSALTFNRRGHAYDRKGQRELAQKDFDDSAHLDPNYVNSLANRGRLARLSGNPDQALEDLNEAIRLNPKYDWALAQRGTIWRDKRELDKSLEDFNEAIRLNSSVSWYHSDRGLTFHQKRQLDEALKDYEAALRLDPKNASAYNGRAFYWRDTGKADKAIADFSQAIELSSATAKAVYYRRRGDIWLANDRYDNAIQDYTESIRLAPETAAYSNRGIALMRSWRFELALAEFEKALRGNPKGSAELNNRGAVQVLLGHFPAALLDLDEAVRINPKLSAPHFWLGYAWEKQGEQEKAKQEYDAYVSAFSKPADALRDRATRWTQWREYGKAIGDFTALLELEPDNTTVLNQRAWLLATAPEDNLREGNQALLDATKANEATAFNDPVKLDTLAAACAEIGDLDQAVKWEEKALDLASEINRDEFTAHLALYREGNPYREPPKVLTGSTP